MCVLFLLLICLFVRSIFRVPLENLGAKEEKDFFLSYSMSLSLECYHLIHICRHAGASKSMDNLLHSFQNNKMED